MVLQKDRALLLSAYSKEFVLGAGVQWPKGHRSGASCQLCWATTTQKTCALAWGWG